MKQLVTAFLCVGLSQTVLAGVYDIKFQRVAAYHEQERCQAFIEKTAQDFAAQSKASILDYGCKADEYTRQGLDAVITYQAPKELILTSTYIASVYSAGFYTSRDECTKQLAKQKELFVQATGLEPLTAYCALDVSSLTQLWATQVDGLGQPALSPDAAGVSLWGTIVDEESVIANYQTAGEGYGITVFESGIYRAGLGKKLVIRIYAPEPYSIDDYHDMKYDSIEACSSAASAVRAMMEASDKSLVAFCENSGNKNFVGEAVTLHATTFVKTLTPTSVFDAKELTKPFATMKDCQKSAAGITGSDIFGAICAGYSKNFHIHVFSRPQS